MKISAKVRKKSQISSTLFTKSGSLITTPYHMVQKTALQIQQSYGKAYTPGNIVAISLLHRAYRLGIGSLLKTFPKATEERLLGRTKEQLGTTQLTKLLTTYIKEFPSNPVYLQEISPKEELKQFKNSQGDYPDPLWETLIIRIMNMNPAMEEFSPLVDEQKLTKTGSYLPLFQGMYDFFTENPLPKGRHSQKNLIELLLEPARRHPHSLLDQLAFIAEAWKDILDMDFLMEILRGMDFLKEEVFSPAFFGGGDPEVHAPDLGFISDDYTRFSEDKHWMPEVVMVAKNTLVWLYQLSEKYHRSISRLDQIPDEELDELQSRGFSALWLIGLWERSEASKRVKQWMGNPDAAASAYSLKGYYIAESIGGYLAMVNLRERCEHRGIRLASDMVPNHTGIDSDWVINHPDRFLSTPYPPFPSYTYQSGNLLENSHIGVYIEDHYYDQTDAAVTFKRVDFNTGETSYIYHGNDGTSMPWNDTAQLDYLNPETREAIIQIILEVARNFSIIRFDAAMTLAKKHIQRLWFPKPGEGGVIASRSAHGMSTADFNRAIPHEFWREVVDRVAQEVPDCLLLAEAFWMMEGFFVRTLGMHRVYNSAFMHMLKNEDNQKFRSMIKETIAFDPGILQRYVNFMSNPDEETAIEQFGAGDKYFGVATILATLPGLPMVGHGQFEGYYEKYGMEFQRSYYNEEENQGLLDAHKRLISPLFQQRASFAGAKAYALYDFHTGHGVNEHVYAYTNIGRNGERSLVLVNNSYYETDGTIGLGAPVRDTETDQIETPHLFERLGGTTQENRFIVGYAPLEQLYYLWPASVIANGGMHFTLQGYQSKVFNNFHEIHDTTGAYQKLWEMHGSTGIADIHTGALLLRLERAHQDLTRFLHRSSPAGFEAVLRSPAKVEKFLQEERTYLRRFLVTLCEDLHLPTEMVTQSLAKHRKIIQAIGELKLCDSSYSTSLYNLMLQIRPEILTSLYAWSVIKPIQESGDFPFGKLLITPELCTAYMGESCNCSATIESLVSATLSVGDWFTPEKSPKQLLEEIFWVEDVQRTLGIHTYKGKVYYKKEQFSPLILHLNLSAMIEHRDHRRDITNITKQWLLAESAANYQIPNILKELEDLPGKH